MVNSEKIGINFLKGYDEFIKKGLRYITCHEVGQLYWDFSKNLKEYKGNSHGFTGLSEYLIFKFVYNQLRKSFKVKDLTKDTKMFYNGTLTLGQNIFIKLSNGKKYQPDIVIKKDNEIRAIIEIKTFPNSGQKEIETVVTKFNDIYDEYEEMKAILIIYQLSKTGKIRDKANYYNKKHDWFNYIELKDNNESLHSELKTKLFLPAGLKSIN